MATFLGRFKVLSFIVFIILAGCNKNETAVAPTIVSPQVIATDLPSLKYQLTYVMQHSINGRLYRGIIAVDIQCVDKEILCFGPPNLVMNIPDQSGANIYDPYGEILSYSWSPDGDKIAFSAFSVAGDIDIFVADWNGDNLKNITISPGKEIFPSWSINNQLIYTVCTEGSCHAVINDENGKNSSIFPFNSAVVYASWMPKGEQVLFVGADDRSVYQIYIANINGSNVKQITQTIENNIVEDASTDGNLIFFTRLQSYADNNFNYNIFSIDLNGKKENIVTTDKDLISYNPSAAPFGSWLAYQQGRGINDIYVTSFDGKHILQVTTGEGDKRIPEWRVVVNP